MGVLGAPLAAPAQQTNRPPRVGVLNGVGVPTAFLDAFREGLRALGWRDGENVLVEYRFAESDRIPEVAAELVRRRLDVIVLSAGVIHRARPATVGLPTVFVIADDPVRAGYAASLARPAGLATGLTSLNIDLDAKRLEILKMALPSVTRVGVLATSVDPMNRDRVAIAEQGARALGLQLHVYDVPTADRLPGAFERAARGGVGAVVVLGSPALLVQQARIVELAAKARLPVISAWQEFPNRGGLISYGTNVSAMYRRAASYVDRILKGASPANLPVERAATFELVVNLKTANALGLSLPADLLARADRLIE